MTEQLSPGEPTSTGAPPERDPVLLNVVIHLNNEQPVVADLFEFPSARDVAVICTNMRTPDGKKPIFIDQTESIFVIPLAHIRFIELPGGGVEGVDPRSGRAAPGSAHAGHGAPPPEPELEIDEDFLRRIRDA